jgi:opacity protein-like surface antigen
MRKILTAVLAATLLAVPAAASAQFNLGARLGYGIPGGEIVKDVKTSSWIDHEIPVQVDASYKVLPMLSIGAYFAYGAGTAKSGSGLDSVHDTRLGVRAAFAFMPGERLDPWIGLGTGWGWLGATGGGTDMTIDGWEKFTVEGGVDYGVTKALALGLFASYASGDYTNGKITIPSTKWASGAIGTGEVASHGLFTIGVRGAFDL